MESKLRVHRVALSLRLTLALISMGILSIQPTGAASSQVVTRFGASEPIMALTFDAGSDRGYASQILDTLKTNGIHAIFGMTGLWAQQNPDLVKRLVDEGHELINHSWDHPNFTSISPDEIASQLQCTDDLVRSLTGATTVPFFRPPYGSDNQSVLDGVARSVRYLSAHRGTR